MAITKRQQISSVGKDVEKREPLFTVGRNINCCSHYGKQYVDSSKIKIKNKTPYDLAILLLGITLYTIFEFIGQKKNIINLNKRKYILPDLVR